MSLLSARIAKYTNMETRNTVILVRAVLYLERITKMPKKRAEYINIRITNLQKIDL